MNITKKRQVRRITALLTFVTALIILLVAPSHIEFEVPFDIDRFSELFDSFLTAAIFYASIGLLRGKRGGWFAAVTILAISTIWEIIISRHTLPILALIPLTVLCLTLATRRLYRAKTERSDSRLVIVGLITVLTTLIGCVGYLLLAVETHRHFSLADAIFQSLRHMYSLNTSWVSMMHPHLHTPVLAYLGLFWIGVLNYTLIAAALLQPVIDSTHDGRIRDIRKILARFSANSEDYFKIFPRDKHYFMDPHVDGFIAYSQHENICIMLADPIACDQKEQQKLLGLFQLWCHTHDLRPAAVPVLPTSVKIYENNGFSTLKIGENAVVDLKKFATKTISDKYFRNVINRLEKAGTTIEILKPPHDTALMDELQIISNQWLTRGHEERGFALGYFDWMYLNQCEIIVTSDAAGAITGFINLLPSSLDHASFDLMRTADHAPKNTIDFLLAKTCLMLHERGKSTLDFGLAPLSGLSDSEQGAEKVLDFIGKRAARWYNFHGLRQFKNKFDPEWEPTYLVYEGGSHRLMAYAVALLAILDRPVK